MYDGLVWDGSAIQEFYLRNGDVEIDHGESFKLPVPQCVVDKQLGLQSHSMYHNSLFRCSPPRLSRNAS